MSLQLSDLRKRLARLEKNLSNSNNTQELASCRTNDFTNTAQSSASSANVTMDTKDLTRKKDLTGNTATHEITTDNRTWMEKIESHGNQPEDWLEYTRYINQNTPFSNVVQKHNYLCDIYEKAFAAIPLYANKKNEAYAKLFVEYAAIKSDVLPDEAIQLMSQARSIVRKFAFVHIMAAELELRQGNTDKAKKILDKAILFRAEPEEKITIALKQLKEKTTTLLNSDEKTTANPAEIGQVGSNNSGTICPPKSPVTENLQQPKSSSSCDSFQRSRPVTKNNRMMPMRVKRMGQWLQEMTKVDSEEEDDNNKENDELLSQDFKPLDPHTNYSLSSVSVFSGSSGYNSMMDICEEKTEPEPRTETRVSCNSESDDRHNDSVLYTKTPSSPVLSTNSGGARTVTKSVNESPHRQVRMPLADVSVSKPRLPSFARPVMTKSESAVVLTSTPRQNAMMKSASESRLQGSAVSVRNHVQLSSAAKSAASPEEPPTNVSPPTVEQPHAPPSMAPPVTPWSETSNAPQNSRYVPQQSAPPAMRISPQAVQNVAVTSTVPQQMAAPSVAGTQAKMAPPLPNIPPQAASSVPSQQTGGTAYPGPTPSKQSDRPLSDVGMVTPSMKGVQPPVPSTPAVQMESISVNGKQYWVLQLVGKGGSSKVYKVLNDNLEIRTIKVVNLTDANEQILEGYRNEIRLLERLQYCPKVIKMYDFEYVEDQGMLLIVMEFGTMDFAVYIKKTLKEDGHLSANLIKFHWEDMLQAVGALHKEGIIHSDLKPSNFMVIDGRLKLIDFGIAKAIQQDKTSVMVDTQVGTLNYMSPETIVDSCGGQSFDESGKKRPVYKIGVKSDVWSLGCILYYMVYGYTPFQKITKVFIKFQAICNPNYPIEFKEIPDRNLLDVIKQCMTRDPKYRPGIEELLEHTYITNSSESKEIAMETDCQNIHLERLVLQLADKFAQSPGGIRTLVNSAMKKDGS